MTDFLKTESFELAVYARGDKNATKLAVVIPGRLDTKDYIHLTSLVDYLAAKGYYALSFDPPGSWESPGGIEQYTTTNILKAVNEIIEHFGNRPTVVLGHSRGGSNAMLIGTANPHVTHFVAIMSSVEATTVNVPADKDGFSLETRDLPPGTSRTTERKTYTLPYPYFEDQRQYSALEALKTCTKPKLFFYGTQDVLVSKEEVEKAYWASAEPKQIHALDTEHDYRLHPDMIDEVNRTIGGFLAYFRAGKR
jgi:pimeloyl-ACP methyl ester carboxylesterase